MTTTPPRPPQLDSAVLPKIFKRVGRAQVWIYRRTGGSIGGKWRIGAGFRKPVPTLLLEHRGRKTSAVYTVPLLYITDGPDTIVVASQSITAGAIALILAAMAIGAVIGLWRARSVEMTQMPELIAVLHSFVGLAAVLVGWNSYL